MHGLVLGPKAGRGFAADLRLERGGYKVCYQKRREQNDAEHRHNAGDGEKFQVIRERSQV